MYLDVIWWIKNSKPFEIVNFTRTSEIYDCILSILWYSPEIGTRVDFLKLEFSILIVWPPNFFWEVFEYIQNFCHVDFFISSVQIQKIDFWTKLLFFQVLREIHFSFKWLTIERSLMIIVHSLFKVLFQFDFIFWEKFKMIYHLNLACLLYPARHKARNSASIFSVKNIYLCKSISNFQLWA